MNKRFLEEAKECAEKWEKTLLFANPWLRRKMLRGILRPCAIHLESNEEFDVEKFNARFTTLKYETT